MADQVTVPVSSPFFSKINWTQAVGFLAMLVSYFGINVPSDVQAAILAGITAVTTIATWVLRTWFTKSVTSTSVK